VECFVNFFVMNDIDIHQLNIGPFIILKCLVKNPFKKCVFLYFFCNKCIMMSFY